MNANLPHVEAWVMSHYGEGGLIYYVWLLSDIEWGYNWSDRHMMLFKW